MIQSVWKNLTGLIPAEHLCVTLNTDLEPKTNDLYIHYMDKSTETPPSVEEKKTLTNCGNKDGNIILVLKNCISTSVATVVKCMKWLNPYVQVIGVWWWVFGSRSAFKVEIDRYIGLPILFPIFKHFKQPRVTSPFLHLKTLDIILLIVSISVAYDAFYK